MSKTSYKDERAKKRNTRDTTQFDAVQEIIVTA